MVLEAQGSREDKVLIKDMHIETVLSTDDEGHITGIDHISLCSGSPDMMKGWYPIWETKKKETFTQMCLECCDCPFIQWSKTSDPDYGEPDGCWLGELGFIDSYEKCRLTPEGLLVFKAILSGAKIYEKKRSLFLGGGLAAYEVVLPELVCPTCKGSKERNYVPSTDIFVNGTLVKGKDLAVTSDGKRPCSDPWHDREDN